MPHPSSRRPKSLHKRRRGPAFPGCTIGQSRQGINPHMAYVFLRHAQKLSVFTDYTTKSAKWERYFCKKLINSFLFFPVCGKCGKQKAAPVSGAAHGWTWRDSPSRALKKPRRGFFARRDAGRRALYGLRCPHQAAPLGRGLPSATAAPASAPCFRRRRRSPLQLFDSLLVPPRKGKDKIKAQPLDRCCALVDLEGFEPLTSRMRTERSPN